MPSQFAVMETHVNQMDFVVAAHLAIPELYAGFPIILSNNHSRLVLLLIIAIILP
jgi:hypothetical protein